MGAKWYILLNETWVKGEIKKEIQKSIDFNENKTAKHQNLCVERPQINNLILNPMAFKTQEQVPFPKRIDLKIYQAQD